MKLKNFCKRETAGMKILMMFPYAPLPPPLDLGGTKRNLPFMLENVKRHEVSVITYGTPEEEKIFRQAYGNVCKHIRFINKKRPRFLNGLQRIWFLVTGRSHFRHWYRKSMQHAIDEMMAREKFDLIHTCIPMFSYFTFPKGVPVVSDTHEVTYDLVERIYKSETKFWRKLMLRQQYKLGKREELELCAKVDGLIATQERDYGVFKKELPQQRLFVIQNGAGENFFEPMNVPIEPHSMVFTGLMTHYPNNHGVLWFLDEVFPRILREVPDAKVYVVGKDPSKQIQARNSDNVIITGFVDDVRPYMAKAEAYIVPLLVGGGIRGKALEAMAMKKAIVTTTIGCEAIHLTHNHSALFADTSEAFANEILRVFRDPGLRQTISNNAYRTAVDEYTWEAKGLQLEAVYQSVVRRNGKDSLHSNIQPVVTENII